VATILYIAALMQQPEQLISAGNAAVVTVLAQGTPQTVYSREGATVEVPVLVSGVEGHAGYQTVTVSLRYDGSRLEWTGMRPGLPGTLSKPIDGPRASTGTLRRISVTWAGNGESMEVGELFVLTFKVKPLPSGVDSASTAVAFDSAAAKASNNMVLSVDKRNPTTLVIERVQRVALVATIRGVTE
jgi:hypothetical protein